jgi:RNA polymerase sigma factor (sigma-70 family)
MRAALSEALGDLRRTMPLTDESRLSDAQLLERFLAARDEAAFAALVRRHGPMVLGVCRRVLRHHHDAEDAFQAAFLVLARKAAAVRRESLGNWLYTVAYHAALEARAAAARRRARERQVETMPHPEVPPAPANDWRPLLDRELHRLPEKYRAAVVLCDLEGKSRKEAAGELGIAEGTLSSRLATARGMLARRLARCGVSLAGGIVAVGLAQEATAAVPSSLVNATVQAAALVAAGGAAAVATPAAGLMKGVLKAMLWTKLKIVVAAAMVTAVLGAGSLVYRAAGQPAAPEEKPATDPEALRKENELLRLNIQVLLEKIRSLEAELAALKGQPGEAAQPTAKLPTAVDSAKPMPKPTRSGLTRQSNIAGSQNNLKQLGLAFHNYADTYGGKFPPAAIAHPPGKPLLSWRVALLPWLEQDRLYKEFHLDEPWDSEHNKKLLDQMPKVFELPGVAMKQRGLTVYQVFVGRDALFENTRQRRFPAEITDGTSNTILVVEAAEAVPWTKPADIPFGDKDPRTQIGGWYGDYVNIGMCDGSVRRMELKKISQETLRNAIMPNDGNVLGPDW